MIINYFKIALRNLAKKKVYTVINVVGLAIGAAASLIIFLYVQHEFSYDKFYPEADQLYRVAMERKYPDHSSKYAMIPGGFSTIFPEEIPEIEKSTRLIAFGNFANVVRYGDKVFQEYNYNFADSNFLDVMGLELIKGDPRTALTRANEVVITTSMAKKYFGDEEPLGKTLQVNGVDTNVSGLVADMPENSHMVFNFLGSTRNVQFLEDPSYYIISSYTYLRLAKGADPSAVESKIPALVEKYAAGQLQRNLGVDFKQYLADGNGYVYFLQPVKDIHLHSNLGSELKANGSITYVKVLIFVGLLIVVIAGINFINLATARSAERAKEVGVRKVLGSMKKQLIYQFLSESFLLSVLGMVIAVVLIQMVLPFFNTLAGKQLAFTITENPTLWIVIAGITLTLGLVAGFYPALVISALKPVQVLKGKFRSSSKGNLLRNGLVVFQFSISMVLISSTLVVFNQLDFIRKTDLGFERENVVSINFNSNGNQSEAIQNELAKVPGVVTVSSVNSLPGEYFFGIQFRQPGVSEVRITKGMNADDDLDETIGLRIKEGRAFGPAFNDSLSVILNESAVKAMGLTEPLGTQLTAQINDNDNTMATYTVVGVVEDFNFESLHTPIVPLAIMSTEGTFNFQNQLALKVRSVDLQETMQNIEQTWKRVVPDQPFVSNFLDSSLSELYNSESTSGKLLTVFAAIAILVASIGLFGLAAYTTSQRTKEIGVRKVLGASVLGIVNLISRDFAKLMAIAFVVGTPVAFFLSREWLSGFAYRISLNAFIFIAAGLLILLIAGITISYQAIAAARANPVNSLKEE